VSTPALALRPFVREYIGWFEHMVTPLCRREMPSIEAPLIINFGSPIRMYDVRDSTRYTDTESFITGAYDVCQIVGSAGPSSGVQANLTLLGIRRLIGRPIEDLTNRAASLDSVFGALGRELAHRLWDAGTWERRFDLLDHFLIDRLLRPSTVPPEVQHAWTRLATTHGRVPIKTIVDETGWSQKHLIARFRHEIGLSPKTLARVLRFGRAVSAIKRGAGAPLVDLAILCGYYDQSHFTRDVHDFAGTTPGRLIAGLLPDRGGITV
jgi:AraC-like DNA-binding protein